MRNMNKTTRPLLLLAGWLLSCNAFVVQSPFLVSRQSTLAPLNYRDGKENPGDEPQNEASVRRVKPRGLTVPLIGPIPGGQPLIMGGEMFLDPPTPMQWSALEESVAVHQKFNAGTENVTAIKAAPLVAIIDDVSGKSQDGLLGPHGRYATLAAVVGISTPKKNKKIDSSSESSFMESIMRASASEGTVLPLDSRVRLVGVGRAVLRDFFYKLPTHVEEMEYDEYEEDEEDEEDDDHDVPIVMAEFDLLTDTPRLNYANNDIGSKGARSRYMSPVHMINEMAKVSNRVTYLHDDRRRLVAGIKAAQARLDLASGQHDVFDDEFVDHDGLGLLFGGGGMEVEDEMEDGQVTIDEFLERFQGGSSSGSNKGLLDEKASNDDKEDLTDRLESLDNFGLGYYSAFSSIPELTSVSLKLFEPYYSEARRQEEEHELEVLSFVAFRALEGVATPEDMAWSLQCTNSVERLNRAYDLMWQHKLELEQVAQELSNKLRDCGEECTDLW